MQWDRPLATRHGRVQTIEQARLLCEFNGNGFSFSPDGSALPVASDEGVALLWDIHTDAELARMPHEFAIRNTAFGPDGIRLLTVSDDFAVRLWDAAPNAKVSERSCYLGLKNVKYNPNNRSVFAYGGNNFALNCDIWWRD